MTAEVVTIGLLLVLVAGLFAYIIQSINSLKEGVNKMAATLDDLLTKVAAEKTVDDSIIALLVDVKAKLDAAIASGDLTKIQAIADALDAEQQKIVAAVVANTPAA